MNEEEEDQKRWNIIPTGLSPRPTNLCSSPCRHTGRTRIQMEYFNGSVVLYRRQAVLPSKRIFVFVFFHKNNNMSSGVFFIIQNRPDGPLHRLQLPERLRGLLPLLLRVRRRGISQQEGRKRGRQGRRFPTKKQRQKSQFKSKFYRIPVTSRGRNGAGGRRRKTNSNTRIEQTKVSTAMNTMSKYTRWHDSLSPLNRRMWKVFR